MLWIQQGWSNDVGSSKDGPTLLDPARMVQQCWIQQGWANNIGSSKDRLTMLYPARMVQQCCIQRGWGSGKLSPAKKGPTRLVPARLSPWVWIHGAAVQQDWLWDLQGYVFKRWVWQRLRPARFDPGKLQPLTIGDRAISIVELPASQPGEESNDAVSTATRAMNTVIKAVPQNNNIHRQKARIHVGNFRVSTSSPADHP